MLTYDVFPINLDYAPGEFFCWHFYAWRRGHILIMPDNEYGNESKLYNYGAAFFGCLRSTMKLWNMHSLNLKWMESINMNFFLWFNPNCTILEQHILDASGVLWNYEICIHGKFEKNGINPNCISSLENSLFLWFCRLPSLSLSKY